MKRKNSLGPLALSLCLAACGGGSSSSTPDAPPGGAPDAPPGGGPDAPPGGGPDAGSVSSAGTIIGVVSDIGTGARVSGATVSGGGKTTTTDSQGEFALTGLPDGDVHLSITKEGYAPGFANGKVGDAAGGVVASLKRQGELQAYDPSTAQTLFQKTEAGPYAVIFQPNSLDTTDTNLEVSVTPLDPTKERRALPGSLVSGGTSPTPLVPVTFAEFTILDSQGTRVALKPAASAIVELPIPPSLRAAYPIGAKIHCYAYDPATGRWEDFVEGTVQTSSVDGTSPVLAAAVRHFSWYGGAPQGNDCADVYVSVVSAVDGRPLGNARVEATPGTVAYTDADGSAMLIAGIGNTSSTFTAYQTGFDVDGSLTGIKGAKYIEFGEVQEDLVGLVPRPCNGGSKPARRPQTQGSPLVIKVGLIKNFLYEANATLVAAKGGSSGSVSVVLQQGVPGPDGMLVNPAPASGAIITVAEPGGTPVMLTEAAAGTGVYFAAQTLTLTAGKTYTLAIDGDGNGSFEGTGSVVAVGDLAWVSPTDGADVAAAGLRVSWSDTGAAAGNPAYAPVYQATIASTDYVTDAAFYLGTAREFDVTSALNAGEPLAPGTYTATLVGFSGFFSSVSGGVQVAKNITGTGVTGMFFSVAAAVGAITFTVH